MARYKKEDQIQIWIQLTKNISIYIYRLILSVFLLLKPPEYIHQFVYKTKKNKQNEKKVKGGQCIRLLSSCHTKVEASKTTSIGLISTQL